MYCKPSLHFSLAENMSHDGVICIWDGLVIDNETTRCTKANMFSHKNNKLLQYRYEKNVEIYVLQKVLKLLI